MIKILDFHPNSRISHLHNRTLDTNCLPVHREGYLAIFLPISPTPLSHPRQLSLRTPSRSDSRSVD